MDKIEQALLRTTDTKRLLLGSGVLEKVPAMFADLFAGQTALVVADAHTWRIAGERIDTLLRAAGIPVETPFIFTDPDLYAEWGYLEELEVRLRDTPAIPVAVGSGVINDLTKLASGHLGRKYMVVGTAASMDGYTAYGASITFEGNKQTFSCPAPYGMVLDGNIAAKAPAGMSASGYADLIAKVPAAADWMLADAVAAEKIDSFSYALVQDGLKETLAAPDRIAAGDSAATAKLAEGLIMSGFAMQALQSSRPASGLEHQFSHYWDMDNLCYRGKHVSHGFKVGIGTLVSTACLEFLLETDLPAIDAQACAAAWPTLPQLETRIRALFAGKSGHLSRALVETRDKYVDAEGVFRQIRDLQAAWPGLKARIRAQLYPFDELKEKLRAVGAPYEPEMIGVSRERLRDTFRRIPYMRSRFTCIDVLQRCGLLEEMEHRLFGPGGHWEV
ncbi:MAG: sn-glycerol-1-phosphate dehydrogenase [Bacteroidales bacterium]|nr:sn-glycerol-1-phosphate dehydrogenase [Bacteroidales bacterium]